MSEGRKDGWMDRTTTGRSEAILVWSEQVDEVWTVRERDAFSCHA